ncbi:MAG: helix-turn-helix domain-containing protein [Myxococcota bacterium]
MARPKGRQSAEVARQTKHAILKAAGRQFAAQGFRATSVRDIAAEAGTTHGLIRHHFGSKEELWRAVVRDFAEQVAALQLSLREELDATDPLELMRTLSIAFLRQSAAMPEISRLVLLDCVEPGPRLDYLVDNLLPVHVGMEPLFERVQAAGHLVHHDNNSFFIFLIMVGVLPFTLADFTNRFYPEDVRTKDGIEAHIQRVSLTLFGEPRAP